MGFIWDSANTAHIAIHGVTPEEAEQVIQNDPLDLERQIRNHEERFVHLGETNSGRVLFVIVAVREDSLRVVTAFPADKAARKHYLNEKAKSHGQDPRDP
jgi:uncharacterized DUF497 family protein